MINIKNLSNSEVFKKIYRNYYTLDKTPKKDLSSMWNEFYPQIKVNIDGDENLMSLKSRGFSDIKYKNPLSKSLNYLCNFSYFWRLPYKNDLNLIMSRIRPKLRKIGSFITYNCFRQICSLILIKKHLNVDSSEYFDAVIIGDGNGIMALLIKELYPNARITLIDIGKVLLFQTVNLQLIYLEYRHILIGSNNANNKFGFLYVPSEEISEIKNTKYKLSVNIASMQEMNQNSIKNYFSFLRSNSTPDNLFYCCNRILKELPGGEILEYIKYPWHEKDKHFIDEEPAFYGYSLTTKFPFIHYLDGKMRHRLTNLFTREKSNVS